jgi:16S rRNA processing protein RimM
MTRAWVEVAQIGRVHGLRGELRVRPINPDSELLRPGRRFRAVVGAPPKRQPAEPVAEQTERDLVIEQARCTGSQDWLVKFVGIDQREVAAALTNSKLLIRREDMPEPDPDEEGVYLSDLVGLAARDPNGRDLGTLQGFFFNGAHDVAVVVRSSGQEILVPFLDDTLIDVDVAAGHLTMEVPEGIPGLDDEEG